MFNSNAEACRVVARTINACLRQISVGHLVCRCIKALSMSDVLARLQCRFGMHIIGFYICFVRICIDQIKS